MIIYIDCT